MLCVKHSFLYRLAGLVRPDLPSIPALLHGDRHNEKMHVWRILIQMNVGAYYVLLPKAFACEIIGIHEHCIGLTVWRELAVLSYLSVCVQHAVFLQEFHRSFMGYLEDDTFADNTFLRIVSSLLVIHMVRPVSPHHRTCILYPVPDAVLQGERRFVVIHDRLARCIPAMNGQIHVGAFRINVPIVVRYAVFHFLLKTSDAT